MSAPDHLPDDLGPTPYSEEPAQAKLLTEEQAERLKAALKEPIPAEEVRLYAEDMLRRYGEQHRPPQESP